LEHVPIRTWRVGGRGEEGVMRCGGVGSLLLVVGIAVLAAPPAASARLRLRVTVGSPPSTLAPGGFTVAYKVTRKGSGLRTATLAAFLSPTRKKTAGSMALAGKASLAKLRRKPTVKGKLALHVPATVRPGRYYLLACIARVKGRGAKAARACGVAPSKIVVPAPPAPVVTPAPPGLPALVGLPGTPGPADGGPIDTTPVPFVPSPLNVAPALDSARAVTQTVDGGGAALTATGADGTVYRLVLPFRALTDPEEITMTPLAAIAGLPFGDGHGVQLSPDGLSLADPARLSITPPAPVPLAEQAAFSYLGTGTDLHLYPTSHRDDVLEFELTHFSAYGYGKGSAADRAAQAKRVPTDREAWARQNLARAGQELTLAKKEGRTQDAAQWIAAFWVAWFVWGNEGVRGALDAALANDAAFEQAATEYGAWRHQGAILDLEPQHPELVSELEALFEKAAEFFAQRAFERCVQNKDPYQATRMLLIERQFQLFGGSPTGQADFAEKIDKCARMDLEVGFRFSYVPDSPAGFHGVDAGTITFHIRPFANGGNGIMVKTLADHHVTGATFEGANPDFTWTWTETVISQRAEARGPTIDWRKPGADGEPRVPIVELGFSWGGISEKGTYRNCANGTCTSVPNAPSGVYLQSLLALYAAELNSKDGIKYRRWDIETGIGNEVFATKEFERAVHSDLLFGTGAETVTMRLLHKPVP
jgi:hypothetical protein